jgi:LysM repeat protein
MAVLRKIPPSERVPYTRVRTRAGDTFATVARRVGLTTKQLAWFNPSDGKKRGRLPTGTEILVPSGDVVQAARDVPDPAIEIYSASAQRHIVRRGDTLIGIARRYRTSVAALKRLNRLRTDRIFAGQSLRVR